MAKVPPLLKMESLLRVVRLSVIKEIVPPKPLRVTFWPRVMLGAAYCCKFRVVTLTLRTKELALKTLSCERGM